MSQPDLTREQGILITGSLVILATVALSFALYYTSSVGIPLVLALLVVYLVEPIVDALQLRLRAPRWLAILAAFIVIGLGTGLLSLLVWSSINGLADEMPVYRQQLQDLSQRLVGYVELIPDNLRPSGLDTEGGFGDMFSDLSLQSVLQTLGTGATNLFGVLTNLIWNAILVVLFAVIIIAGRRPLETRTGLWGIIDGNVQKYLSTKFVASAMTGIFTWLLLWMVGLKLSLMFGVLAFVLNFIPSVGSLIAMILPLPVAVLQFGLDYRLVLAIALPGSVQFLIGNVLEPRMQGDNLDLHPITVLLTLIFWTTLWGVPGAIISTPITAVIKLILEQFETTKPVAEILAGRVGHVEASAK